MPGTSTLPRNPTRAVRIGRTTIGGGHPIAVQSMCATKTWDVDPERQLTPISQVVQFPLAFAINPKKHALPAH